MDAPGKPIPQSPAYIKQLHALVHDEDTLWRAGYVVEQLSPKDIARKRRCQRCHRALKGRSPPQAAPVITPAPLLIDVGDEGTANTAVSGKTETSKQPQGVCKFHPGTYSQRAWSCCKKPLFTKPCHGEAQHEPRQYAAGELENDWRYYTTPKAAPKPTFPIAVAIDCEMGTAESGESELIRVSVVDYFTGTVLLDRLVYPSVKMTHFNTVFTGVTRKAMEDARRKKTCLFGRNKARKAVYELIGPETIVIGHGGHGDFISLRWIHPLVIDTLILEQNKRIDEEIATEMAKAARIEEEPREPSDGGEEPREATKPAQKGGLSLKALARTRLNREIQVKGKGHDSTEDALATRDILHWHIEQTMRSMDETATTSARPLV